MYFKKWISQFHIYKGLFVVDFEEFCEAWQHGSVRRRGIRYICFGESSYPFAEPCERTFESLRNFSIILSATFLLVVFLCNRYSTENCQKDVAFFLAFLEEHRQSSKNG